jgi:ribosomal-protein-alanine N-acetyltransferase
VTRTPVRVERLQPPVSAADRDAVIALEGASFASPWTGDAFDRMLVSPVSQVYVARLDGGQIVGFCACWVIDDEVHINTVAVAHTWRRHGIGAQLLREMLEKTRARKATLEVRASNEAALALYRKLGFAVTAKRRDYYQNPVEDGLILWWNP